VLLSHTAGVARTIAVLFVYGSLFFNAIKHNRKNRPIVLGVVTAALFGAFLFLGWLNQTQAPPWLVGIVIMLVMLTASSVLALVAMDVVRWATKQGPGTDTEIK
jgi:hypothetical protein